VVRLRHVPSLASPAKESFWYCKRNTNSAVVFLNHDFGPRDVWVFSADPSIRFNGAVLLAPGFEESEIVFQVIAR
jgi:hypothetical protein